MSERGSGVRDKDLELRVRRPVGAVLSVRVPRDLAIHVDEHARQRSMTMSDVVRDALELYLAHPPLRVTMSLYGSSSQGRLSLNAATVAFVEPTRSAAQTETVDDTLTRAV